MCTILFKLNLDWEKYILLKTLKFYNCVTTWKKAPFFLIESFNFLSAFLLSPSLCQSSVGEIDALVACKTTDMFNNHRQLFPFDEHFILKRRPLKYEYIRIKHHVTLLGSLMSTYFGTLKVYHYGSGK